MRCTSHTFNVYIFFHWTAKPARWETSAAPSTASAGCGEPRGDGRVPMGCRWVNLGMGYIKMRKCEIFVGQSLQNVNNYNLPLEKLVRGSCQSTRSQTLSAAAHLNRLQKSWLMSTGSSSTNHILTIVTLATSKSLARSSMTSHKNAGVYLLTN
ncbi:hypothetical protein BYT27DRAFT_6526913 [Phlegmacium glaucopus]|nr:hypothetical protein BYT27DRAFT_6526913 [Phlegmacium glaucopus]